MSGLLGLYFILFWGNVNSQILMIAQGENRIIDEHYHFEVFTNNYCNGCDSILIDHVPYWKHFALFPDSEMEIMTCCEYDTISMYGLDQYQQLRNKLGSNFNNKYNQYKINFLSAKKNYRTLNKHRSLLVKKNNQYTYVFELEMKYCDCQILKFTSESVESSECPSYYIKAIGRIRKLNNSEKEIIVQIINNSMFDP